MTTLKDAPGAFATAPVTIGIDTDNNAGTGTKASNGRPGGFEYGVELTLCIGYKDGSLSCRGGSTNSAPAKRYGAAELKRFKGDNDYAETDTILSAMHFPGEHESQQFPVDGKIVTASIDYADIGVKPGQTIRLVPRKTGGSPQHGAPEFPSVMLTLK